MSSGGIACARLRSPASAAPWATSSAGGTTTIGCVTATFAREALERSQVLKRDWNRQVERAAEEGVHVIYTDGYDRLHKELDKRLQEHAPGSRR